MSYRGPPPKVSAMLEVPTSIPWSEEGRKRAADFVVSSSDSEGESAKRSRGRPALNPDHAGKFTAEARAKKVDKAKAAAGRPLEFDDQPLCAIAAVATRELATIAKAVEKLKNIKGDIGRALWTAFAKLVTVLAHDKSRGRSTSRCTSGRDGATGLEWDSTMEWSGPESLAGARSPIRTRGGKKAPAEGVSKQLNPLAAVADRTAPVGKKSPSNKRREKADNVDDEQDRIELLIVRLLPRLLREMGVAPATMPPPKALPAKKGGQTPTNKGAKTAPKADGKAPGVPPSATRVEPSPPAIIPTTGAVGSVTDKNEAT
ncbi:hypothetical protein G5I_11342 [Acromyrmex echinatior]|uniref:Uncharacterized protein n=1 Tax=Acromyrmex echinatior TaxID=103372 RepID=F4WZC4_ACREC|nr:hypothetical protein G5I_11342 [Acromyrmex echinatior]